MDGVSDISDLEGVVGRKLILRRQIVALRVRRLVLEVFADERNAARLDRCRCQWNVCQPVLKCADRAIRECDWSIWHLVRVVQVELERKVVIRQQRRVLEAAVEDSVATAHHQFRSDLVSEADTRSEVCLLRNTEARLARALQRDTICRERCREIGGERSVATFVSQIKSEVPPEPAVADGTKF